MSEQLHMTWAKVVFTGPATLANGTRIMREALVKASNAAGIAVLPRWDRSCDFLVASRTDTVKARGAKDAGVTVVDYDGYARLLKGLGVDACDPKFAEKATPNKFTDEAPKAPEPTGQIGDTFVM